MTSNIIVDVIYNSTKEQIVELFKNTYNSNKHLYGNIFSMDKSAFIVNDMFISDDKLIASISTTQSFGGKMLSHLIKDPNGKLPVFESTRIEPIKRTVYISVDEDCTMRIFINV